jgi:hypothetical protein
MVPRWSAREMQMTFNEMVTVFHAEYVKWYGDDLFAVTYEFGMVSTSPDDHFKGGSEEKEARLFALDAMEMRILDNKAAA